jgi:1-acyl-sn-glycerol-3-phosphate acyltransferase
VFNNKHKLPLNRPLIIASNHQSTYDIPPLIWYFRKHFPKFIAKKELGKGFPSISYNLRHGGAVLIDRKDPIAAVSALEGFCDNIKKNRWSVVIFPEGTRSRNGQPKSFQRY